MVFEAMWEAWWSYLEVQFHGDFEWYLGLCGRHGGVVWRGSFMVILSGIWGCVGGTWWRCFVDLRRGGMLVFFESEWMSGFV